MRDGDETKGGSVQTAPSDDPWARFCDELKRAGEVLRRPGMPDDDITRAEGLRHLVRLIRDGFEMTCEYAHPEHPVIYPMASETLVTELVSPDARYHHAFLDGSGTHRITGSRGTAPFIEFSTYTGRTALHPSHERTGSITEHDLIVDDHGRFEIVLSPETHPGNWIRTDVETRRLFIRQYAHDWAKTETATYAVCREDIDAPRPPLTLAEVVRGLERTADYVRSAPPIWAGISDYWAGFSVNEIVSQEDADSKTDITVPSGHRFAGGYFRLADDEALVVEFRPEAVPYWGLELTNYWCEPLSWPDTRSRLNSETAVYERDGSVRAVICGRRPAVSNWIDTAGHREGTVVFRWSRTNAPMPAFETRVVGIGELDTA